MKKPVDRFYGISGIVYILGVEQRHRAEELLQAIENIVAENKEDIMVAAQLPPIACIVASRLSEVAPQSKEEIMTTIAQAMGQEYEEKVVCKEQVAMGVAEQLRQKGRQEDMYATTLENAKKMLSDLHLDMQTTAQQLRKKYEQKGRQ